MFTSNAHTCTHAYVKCITVKKKVVGKPCQYAGDATRTPLQNHGTDCMGYGWIPLVRHGHENSIQLEIIFGSDQGATDSVAIEVAGWACPGNRVTCAISRAFFCLVW